LKRDKEHNCLLDSRRKIAYLRTTQRSCLLPGFSAPWLPNFASKTAINAMLSCKKVESKN
jgi:hypothetical protein